MGSPRVQCEGQRASWLLRPEQGIGSLHVRLGLIAVGFHPVDLGFELGDPHVEFGARIAIETFAAEQAGGIATGPRAVVVIHCNATSDPRCLLSTGQKARSPKAVAQLQQWGGQGSGHGGESS